MTWKKDKSQPELLTAKDLRHLFPKSDDFAMAKQLLTSNVILDPKVHCPAKRETKLRLVVQTLTSIGCSTHIRFNPIDKAHALSWGLVSSVWHSRFINGVKFNELSPKELIEWGFLKVKINNFLPVYVIPDWYFTSLFSHTNIFAIAGNIEVNEKNEITIDATDEFQEAWQKRFNKNSTFIQAIRCKQIPMSYVISHYYVLKNKYLAYGMLPG